MAFVSTSSHSAGFSSWVKTSALRLREARAKRSVYAQTVRELSALDNRELDDLGISRYGIEEIAYQHVYGAKA